MNKRWTFLACAAVVAIALTACAKPQTAWITDLDEALQASQKGKKALLIVFTGVDWDEKTPGLNEKVFTPEFFAKESKKFVLCNVDIPRDGESVAPEVMERKYQGATEYGVNTIPYLVLISADGDVYGATAINDDAINPEAFTTLIHTYDEAGKTLVGLRKKIAKASGIDKATAIDEYLEKITASQREKHEDLIREVITLDSDGKAGLKSKYLIQVTYLEAINLYKEERVAEAGARFIALAESGQLAPAQEQEAWYMGAYMHAMSKEIQQEQVLAYLEKAIAADPDSESAAQIKLTMEQIAATGQN